MYPWHFISILAIAYLLGHFVALHRLRSAELKALRLNYVNFGLALALCILAFASVAYIFYPQGSGFPRTFIEIAYVVWTLTVCGVLGRSDHPKGTKIVSFVLLLGTMFLHYLFKTEQTGVAGFIRKLDEFTEFGGGTTGAGLKLSTVLKTMFFFVNVFVIVNYYGKVFEIIHRERAKSKNLDAALQEEAIKRAVLVLSVAISFFSALALAGTDVGRLSLFSGLVAAGVSIALRDLLANMAAGVLLLWDKSIKTQDVIALDKERFGVVKSMTMRYLVLEDRNDIRFLVPNSELINKTITNWTQKSRKIRLKLDVGVAFNSEVDVVKKTMKEVCLRVSRVLQDPPPRVLIIGLGDSTINFQLRFFINDPENGVRNVMGEIYELLLVTFKEKKIAIPFPQREIKLLTESAVSVSLEDRTVDAKATPAKQPASKPAG